MKIHRIEKFKEYNSLNVKVNKEIINIIAMNINIIGKEIISVSNVFFIIYIVIILFFIFSFGIIEIFIIYI